MCKDIWEQTPAQRNYENYLSLARINPSSKNMKTALKEAILRLIKEGADEKILKERHKDLF